MRDPDSARPRPRVLRPGLSIIVCLTITAWLLAVAGPALAHHPVLSGTVSCDTGYTVTWSIANSESASGTNRTMIVKTVSVSAGTLSGLVVGQIFPPTPGAGSTQTATTLLPAGTTGIVTLSVWGRWVDKDGVAAGPQNELRTASVSPSSVTCASLHITKTADAAAVSAGDGIGFGITVSNSGPGSSKNVVVKDVLPVGSGLVWSISGGTAASSCAIASGKLMCAIGTMTSGSSASVHISSPTTADSCGTYDNTATASSTANTSRAHGSGSTVNDNDADDNGNGDKDADDNDDDDDVDHGGSGSTMVSATASTRVDCAGIALHKTADHSSATAGDQIGFTITVSNNGEGSGHDIVVSDSLPVKPGLSWSIDGGTMASECAIAAGSLKCSLATLAPDTSKTVHITSATTGVTCGLVTNNASATSANDGSSNASATVTVACPAGITILKTGPAEAHVGDTVAYTFTVNSTTITPLSSVTVTDPNCDAAPAYVSGDDEDSMLEQGESWVYTCSHVVKASDADPLPNTATAEGTGNGVKVTDSDNWSVDIIHPAISIAKDVNPLSGSPGDPVTYTYVVKNIGDTTLFNVTVADDKLGTIARIGPLAAGQTQTVTKTSTISSTGGALVNTGSTSGTDVLGKLVSDSDTASVTSVLGTKLIQTGRGTAGPRGWATGLATLLIGLLLLAISRRRAEAK